jgi:hypothetical protein
MSFEDPEETLKTILEGVALKMDDDTAIPSDKVLFGGEFEEKLLANYFAVFTVGQGDGGDEHIINSALQRHVVEVYTVKCFTKDAEGLSARRLLWDMICQVKQVIGARSKSPGGILKQMSVIGVKKSVRIEPTPRLYAAEIRVKTHRFPKAEEP